jgi:hypothetical protein
VWTAFFALAPGEERTLAFTYELPAWVTENEPDGQARYRLQVLKQPGTGAVPLQLAFHPPPEARVTGAVPSELGSAASGEPGAATDLRIDRAFELVFDLQGGEP